MTTDIADGLYFGLEEATYHAIPALSSSGIKNLLVSPVDFWARSWMNPDREDEDGDTEARIVGRAYHKRILEGKEAFDALYALPFEPPEDALKTIDEIKTALDAIGQTYPKSAKKPDLVAIALSHQLPVYDALKSAYEAEHVGKSFLGAKLLKRIEKAASMIERHDHLSKMFNDGYPEVTVVWTQDGIRFKARFDYLRIKAIVDLKSFANIQMKEIDNTIYRAFANYKYKIQGAFYLEAVEHAKTFAKAFLPDPATGVAKTFREVNDPPIEWLRQFSETPEHGIYFVFQQTGIAPVARGKKFERGLLYGNALAGIHEGIRRYKENIERFGTDEWIDTTPIDSFNDEDFPQYAFEN